MKVRLGPLKDHELKNGLLTAHCPQPAQDQQQQPVAPTAGGGGAEAAASEPSIEEGRENTASEANLAVEATILPEASEPTNEAVTEITTNETLAEETSSIAEASNNKTASEELLEAACDKVQQPEFYGDELPAEVVEDVANELRQVSEALKPFVSKKSGIGTGTGTAAEDSKTEVDKSENINYSAADNAAEYKYDDEL